MWYRIFGSLTLVENVIQLIKKESSAKNNQDESHLHIHGTSGWILYLSILECAFQQNNIKIYDCTEVWSQVFKYLSENFHSTHYSNHL